VEERAFTVLLHANKDCFLHVSEVLVPGKAKADPNFVKTIRAGEDIA